MVSFADLAIRKYRREGGLRLIESGIRFGMKRGRRAAGRISVRKPVVIRSEESGFYYQRRRQAGVEDRWRLLEPHLDENTSVLDVGCNAGMLTALVGETDRFAVGIEQNSATVADAVEYHGPARRFGLINDSVTRENVRRLPTFDYVFFLSVYHQLYRDQGDKAARSVLSGLGERTANTLFFEPASQKSRYGDQNLPFEDFDRDSILEYNTNLLESVFEDCEVEYLGSSRRMEGEEGKRYLFAVRFG